MNCGVLTLQYIETQLKEILPIEADDTYHFDKPLDIIVSGAISKMISEGIDIEAKDKNGNYIFQEDTYLTQDYILCLGYQAMKDLDYDVNMDFLTEQYITRVGTLRCRLSVLQR